jgi:hypothetical protein
LRIKIAIFKDPLKVDAPTIEHIELQSCDLSLKRIEDPPRKPGHSICLVEIGVLSGRPQKSSPLYQSRILWR